MYATSLWFVCCSWMAISVHAEINSLPDIYLLGRPDVVSILLVGVYGFSLWASVWFKVKRLFLSLFQIIFEVNWLKGYRCAVVWNDLEKGFNQSNSWWIVFSTGWKVKNRLDASYLITLYIVVFYPVFNCLPMLLCWLNLACKWGLKLSGTLPWCRHSL